MRSIVSGRLPDTIKALTKGKIMEYPIKVKLPALFYYDHTNRDLIAGEVIRELGNRVEVSLDEDSYLELMSDSQFYAFEMDYAEPAEYASLTRSAKRTYEILKGLN